MPIDEFIITLKIVAELGLLFYISANFNMLRKMFSKIKYGNLMFPIVFFIAFFGGFGLDFDMFSITHLLFVTYLVARIIVLKHKLL